ncbi:hypothetical protein BaRGS_00027481 [Batillaria attramentaria]|uniref:T-box domain-containing protein n=1 Tax=Batillaria attramentaria TaxID=370345 RepID=A0ABD0K1N2_9CAEN
MAEETQTTEAVVPSQGEAICVERRDGPVALRLLDSALWQSFKQEGTEMIITKAGRRMFPFVMVTLEGLSPTLLYSVHLSLVPCDNRQYKFCQRRWVSVSEAAPGPTPIPPHSYVHPASPNRGSFWCQEMISFAKLKITNNKHSQGDIVLQSMRKYMAQITVREDLGDNEYVFPLPETTFVAVTQYQNEAITRMKIAHNPFANGFKYAHVTGTEDTKRILPRSESTKQMDSKQKQLMYPGAKSTKTARVKATVTPQTLTPTGTTSQSSQQQPPQSVAKLELDCTTDPGHPLSIVMPPGQAQVSGSFPVVSTATVPPFLFEPSDATPDAENEAERYEDIQNCTQDDDNNNNDVDGDEEHEDSATDSASPPATTEACPTVIPTSAEDELNQIEEATQERSPGSRQDPASSAAKHTAPKPFTAEELSQIGLVSDAFKHPLPRRSSSSGSSKKSPKKCASAFGQNVATDTDLNWYRNALRQAALKENMSLKFDRGVQLTLHETHVWKEFHTRGARMAITKDGRTMFPTVTVSVRGLDPARLYSVWLHVTSADDAGGAGGFQNGVWGPLYSFQRAVPAVRPYMHPCSPMRGLAWMQDKIKFTDVKFTSDMTSEDPSSLPLLSDRRYMTQVVVREEEEVTPGSPGRTGDLLFFPLHEVTFTAACESEDLKVTPSATVTGPCNELGRKRQREGGSSGASKDTVPFTNGSEAAKAARIDPTTVPLGSNPTTGLSRTGADPTNRLNPMYYMPSLPTLPPAHVGLSANRMPLGSPLQTIASYPYHPLFHQLRAPLHSAFNMAAFPGFNPFSFFCYPYSVPSIPAVSIPSTEVTRGLDLSVRPNDTR